MIMQQTGKYDHKPVLLEEVLKLLAPKEGESYLDLTAGYGGHAERILSKTRACATLVDRDKNATDFLKKKFAGAEVHVVCKDFLAASQELANEGKKFDLILADLGVSSPHLNTASRGFSIKNEGPLDMRMDESQALTAETIVNSYSQDQLHEIIREFGQEPKARKIAQAIVVSRPLMTTSQLAEVVAKTVHTRGKVHPATRTFQALRVAVNDELGQVSRALPLWIDMLASDGRLAVISFHSLEDRLVKQALGDEAGNRYDATLSLLTKSPVTASQSEIVHNPRARSAKLRAAVKK